MSSNITLYTWPTPNGVKASITLEELGLPYKTEGIDISTNVQKEEYETVTILVLISRLLNMLWNWHFQI